MTHHCNLKSYITNFGLLSSKHPCSDQEPIMQSNVAKGFWDYETSDSHIPHTLLLDSLLGHLLYLAGARTTLMVKWFE